MANNEQVGESEYVLYIAPMREKIDLLCKGSSICLHLIEENNIPCVIQDMDVLRKNKVPFPAWLKGSPTLVKLNPEQIFTGLKAIQELERYTQGTHSSHSNPENYSESQPDLEHETFSEQNDKTPIGGLEEMMQQRGVVT